MERMEKVDRIIGHPLFQKQLMKLAVAEENRIFCRHGMEHLLDVARIAWIMNLEEGAALDREVVYAAALLHDIGKARQYIDKTPHHLVGSEMATDILRDCSFSEEETRLIADAILHHRDSSVKEKKDLSGILYRADKSSRPCYGCKAVEECNWPREKKNWNVKY